MFDNDEATDHNQWDCYDWISPAESCDCLFASGLMTGDIDLDH